ncbi:MAG: hypothetical protein ACR2GQ_08255 [Gemmatimonadota bacterium]|jgi:hypothetical protein
MNHIECRTLRTRGRTLFVGLGLTVALAAGCKPDAPSGPVDTGFSVTMEWTAPTVDADGQPLEDLLGYTLHYRDASPANGPGSRSLDAGSETRFRATGIPAGTWFFGVSARDASGNESALSNEVRLELGP